MDIELEIKAAIRQKAEGWQRTYRAMAKGASCVCERRAGSDARDELQHGNYECPVAIYLRMARLVVEDE
jgi:hypothetical protein